jgi:N-acetylmuramic acid 6-phosphate etherase
LSWKGVSDLEVNITTLTTEQRNNRSANIDQLSTFEIIKLMNEEDGTVAEAVGRVLPELSRPLKPSIIP